MMPALVTIGTGPAPGFPGGYWKLFARPPPELWAQGFEGELPLPLSPPPPPPTIKRLAGEPPGHLADIEQVRTSLAPPPELAYAVLLVPPWGLRESTGGGAPAAPPPPNTGPPPWTPAEPTST